MEDAGERITPAHAGKRDSRVILLAYTQDHPRTRGEKWRAHYAGKIL